MDLKQVEILVQFQQLAVSTIFFELPEKFCHVIFDDKNNFIEMISDFFAESNVKNPIGLNDIEINCIEVAQKVYMIRITYPTPIAKPMCYETFLILDLEQGCHEFYNLERGNHPKEAVLCSINGNKERHVIETFSLLTTTHHDVMSKISNIYMNKYTTIVE